MSLGERLNDMYIESLYQEQLSEKEKPEEAKKWVETVLTPYLIEHASDGSARIDTDLLDLENILDPVYHCAIQNEGLEIECFGRNFLLVSWK